MHNNSKFVILSISEESKQRCKSAGFFAYAQNDEMDNNDHY